MHIVFNILVYRYLCAKVNEMQCCGSGSSFFLDPDPANRSNAPFSTHVSVFMRNFSTGSEFVLHAVSGSKFSKFSSGSQSAYFYFILFLSRYRLTYQCPQYPDPDADFFYSLVPDPNRQTSRSGSKFPKIFFLIQLCIFFTGCLVTD